MTTALLSDVRHEQDVGHRYSGGMTERAHLDIRYASAMPVQITVRELARNTAHVLERVSAGETIEVTRNGEPVAVLSPPDIEEVTVRDLIKQGILPPDVRERQAELFRRIHENPPPPTPPGQRPVSEVLMEMRDEEPF